MIFDLYKQEPIWASTAGDSGSCIDIPQQGSLSQYLSNVRSLHVWESVFRNPWNFFLWNQESGKILLVESGILDVGIWNTARVLLRIGIQTPSFTDKDWNLEAGIWNPRHGIQNLRLSWLPLHGAWQGGRVKVFLEAVVKTKLPTKPALTIQGYGLYFLNPLNPNIKIEILIYCPYTFSIEVVGRI